MLFYVFFLRNLCIFHYYFNYSVGSYSGFDDSFADYRSQVVEPQKYLKPETMITKLFLISLEPEFNALERIQNPQNSAVGKFLNMQLAI